MSETGDFELFGAPQPSEKKEMSDEQFNEEMRRTQTAIKQLKKEEGQAKANDNGLAAIIVQFLAQPQNTDLFLLISRTIALNIPSELIIAILSLIDESAEKEVHGYLAGGESVEPQQALTLHQQGDFQSLEPQHKQAIDNWVKQMFQVTAKRPHRILESIMVQYPEREISPILIQLSAFIVRKYLEKNALNLEFQSIHDFMQGVWVEVVKQLEELVKGQRHLGEAEPS